MDLPPPRDPSDPYRVALVCLGNICRSPMAHVVLADRVDDAGLADRVVVTSAGTGDWHVGHPMDERASATLEEAGYDASAHRAAQVTPAGLASSDVVLAMDAANHADLVALGAGPRLLMFRDFDPAGPGDVPDPYYDAPSGGTPGGFAAILVMVERTSEALVTALNAVLEPTR